MEQSTISIRVDKALKENFQAICTRLGISSNTVFKNLMRSFIEDNKHSYPSIESQEEIRERGLKSFYEMRRIIQESGVKEPSLEEINDMINEVRNAQR